MMYFLIKGNWFSYYSFSKTHNVFFIFVDSSTINIVVKQYLSNICIMVHIPLQGTHVAWSKNGQIIHADDNGNTEMITLHRNNRDASTGLYIFNVGSHDSGKYTASWKGEDDNDECISVTLGENVIATYNTSFENVRFAWSVVILKR